MLMLLYINYKCTTIFTKVKDIDKYHSILEKIIRLVIWGIWAIIVPSVHHLTKYIFNILGLDQLISSFFLLWPVKLTSFALIIIPFIFFPIYFLLFVIIHDRFYFLLFSEQNAITIIFLQMLNQLYNWLSLQKTPTEFHRPHL